MNKATALTFLVLSSASFAFADNVAQVNLLDGNTAYQYIPVYNQGRTGTCYGHAAAQVLDYYRFTHGEKRQSLGDNSSPSWLSAVYKFKSSKQAFNDFADWLRLYDQDDTKPLDGGFGSDAIQTARKYGMCTQTQVESAFAPLNKEIESAIGQKLETNTIISFVQNFSSDLQKVFQYYLDNEDSWNTPASLQLYPSFPKPSAERTAYIVATHSSSRMAQHPQLQLPTQLQTQPSPTPTYSFEYPQIQVMPSDNTQVINSNLFAQRARFAFELATRETLRQYEAALKVQTSQSKQIQAYKLLVKKLIAIASSPELLYQKIHSWFSPCFGKTLSIETPAPKVINSKRTSRQALISGIDSTLRTLNRPLGVAYCARILSDGYDRRGDCGAHESVIVGQRTKSNKLQYLIQNSWGPSCKSGNSLKYFKEWECLEGQGAVWVDGETLLEDIDYVYYL